MQLLVFCKRPLYRSGKQIAKIICTIEKKAC